MINLLHEEVKVLQVEIRMVYILAKNFASNPQIKYTQAVYKIIIWEICLFHILSVMSEFFYRTSQKNGAINLFPAIWPATSTFALNVDS